MHVAACKEFYANLTVSISNEKEVARTRLRGVNIELDSMILASILGVPGNNGICEYIKEGESGSAEKFYDAEDEVQGATDVVEEVPEVPAQVSAQQKEIAATRVDPSGVGSSVSDSDFAKLQAEFEHSRADRIQTELDRAQEENVRLLNLLQQAQSQHKP
ncbi:hypothetical protein Dimus_010555 [Dionaea muscipula]